MAGKNIDQLTITNTVEDTDLYYLGRSPYNNTDDRSISWASIHAALALLFQGLNANLTGISNLNNAFTGPVYQTGVSGGITTYHTPTGSTYSGTSFNNVTNNVNFGDIINFTNSGAITCTLDAGSHGIGYSFEITLTSTGTITFSSLNGINGLTSIAGGGTPSTSPQIKCSIVPAGGGIQWQVEVTNSFDLIAGSNITVSHSGAGTTVAATGLQPLSSNLTALAAFATLGIPVQVSGSVFTARSVVSSNGDLSVSNGDFILANADLALNLGAIRWQPATISATTYTLAATDVNKTFSTTNAGADTTITIPANATAAIPVGAQIKIINSSAAGFVTNIVAAGGVTFTPFTSIVIGLSGYVVLEKTATNTWLILQCYEEYSHSTSWTGIWATPQPGNAFLVRNMRDIEMTIPATLATQNTVSFISMATALPARFRPTANTELQGPSVNNNGNTNGAGTVFSSGAVNIFANSAYGNFGGTGMGGFNRQSIDYTLN